MNRERFREVIRSADRMEYEIVKDDIKHMLGVSDRYYVIAVPINETGVCLEFASRPEAEAYIREQLEKEEEEA